MRKVIMNNPVVALLLVCVAAFVAGPVQASHANTPLTADSATVVVVLVEELQGGPGVSAIVVRRATARPTDLIFLRRGDANGTRLASAVAMLMLQRSKEGSIPGRDTRTILRGAAVPARWRENWLPRFENLVARLRRAEPEDVPGLGRVPAAVLVLPPAASQGQTGA